MTDDLGKLPRTIADLINANERMQVNLEANAVVLKQALRLLNDGTDLADALFLMPGSSPREASEAATKNLIRAREHLRDAIVGAALEAGIPPSLLAERLEVTVDEVSTISGSGRTTGV